MSLTISAAQVDTLIADPTEISGYSASSHIIIDGAITHTKASELNAVDATYIQATISTTSASNLADIDDDNNTRAQANKFAFVIDDLTATAEELNDVLAKTTLSADFSTINEITASPAADVVSLYASDLTSGLGDEDITLNDTTIAADTLNSINDDTSGTVTLDGATTIEGSEDDVFTALTNAGGGVAGLDDIDVTVTSSTGTVDVDVLEDIVDITDGGDGVVSLDSGVTTLEGGAAAAAAVIADEASDFTDDSVLSVNYVLTDATVAVATVAAIQTSITGTITATIDETTGETLTDDDDVSLLTGTGNAFTITISETDDVLDADILVQLAATTTETITISDNDSTEGDQTMSGTASNILDVINGDFTGIESSVAVTASGNTSVAQVNLLTAATTGKVVATVNETDAATLTTLTASDVNELTIQIGDRDVSIADLNTIADATALTDGSIDFGDVETTSGTLDDANTLFVTNADKFSALHVIDITVTDETIDAGTLAAVETPIDAVAGASITIDASTLTGTASEIAAVLDGTLDHISGVGGDEAVTVSGAAGVLDMADVVTTILDAETDAAEAAFGTAGDNALTSGLVTIADDVDSIIGTYLQVHAALTLNSDDDDNGVDTQLISGLDGLAVELDTDGGDTITNINDIIDNYDVGVVTATVASATRLDVLAGEDGLRTGNAITVEATGNDTAGEAGAAAVDAEDVVAVSALTSGTITLTDGDGGEVTITGSLDDIAAIYNAGAALIDATSSAVVIEDSGLISAEDFAAVSGGTDGEITADNVTTISGSAADVVTSMGEVDGDNAVVLGSADVIITDAVLDVSDAAGGLNTLITDYSDADTALTTGSITVISGTITGDKDDVTDSITLFSNTADMSGLDAVNVTGTGDFTFAEVQAVADITTGTITATIDSDATLASSSNLDDDFSGELTITLGETTVAAATLQTLAGKTTGTISIDDATTITGTGDAIESIITNDSITGLNEDEAVVITGSPTVAQINTIAAFTSGTVTAAVTGDATALSDLTDDGDKALTITVTGEITTTEFTTVKSKTTGTVTLDGDATLTGTFDDVSDALGDIDNATEINVTITDSITVANADTLITTQGITGTITATISEQDTTTLTGIDANDNGAFTITVARTSEVDGDTAAVEEVQATDITAIEALTTLSLNVTSQTIEGNIADVLTAFVTNDNENTYASDVAITLDDATNITELNLITDLTTGTVTATMDAATLADYFDDGSLDISTGNALTIDLTDDAEIDAADVNTLVDATSVSVTFSEGGGAVIAGTLSELTTLYASSTAETPKVVFDAAAALTVNDEGSISASDLVDLVGEDDAAEVTIDTTVTALEGTQEDIQAAVDLDGDGTGIAENTLVGRGNNGDPGDADYYIEVAYTVTDEMTVAEANTLIDDVDGVVTATISDTDMATLIDDVAEATDGLSPSEAVHDLTITVDDDDITANDLAELTTRTIGTITVDSSSNLTGDFGDDAANLIAVLGDDDISGISTVSADDSPTVAEVNAITEVTTATVTATVADTDTDTLSGLTGTGNALTVTVATTTGGGAATVDAADINTLDAKTTVAVTVTATTITGALSDITTLYDANADGTVTGLGNEDITVSDTGSISSEQLNDLNSLTTGVVTVNAATTVSGSLSEIVNTYSDSNIAGVITGLSDEAVTVTDTGSIDAANLNTVNDSTDGVVTVSNASTISGTFTDVNAAFTANTAGTIDGLDDLAITISDSTSITSAQANILDGLTSGVVTATISTDDIDSLADLTGTSNAYTITVEDTSVAAASLTTLEGKTTETVTVSSSSITGTASAIDTVYSSDGLTGLGSESVTVDSGTASVAEVNTLDGHTSGLVTATVTEGDMSTLADISGTGNALTISVTDTSVAADELTTLDGKTTVAVSVDATTLTGTNAEQLAAYAANNAGTITGLDSAFDAANYLASHSDLLDAFGSNTVSAKTHFFDFGVNESRTIDGFDESTYLASYDDLLAAFGSDTSSAVTHYVEYGYSESRATDNFDELGYIASYSDLITAFGADSSAAVNHYISFGYNEGRSVTFDAASYLAAEPNSDLRTAFGDDLELAKQHYIEYGVNENRALA